MNETAIGMPWYRREDYPKILAALHDSPALPRSYEAWLAQAEKQFRDLEGRGIATARVEVRPDVFVAWCRAQGIEPDRRSLLRFASDEAAFMACGAGAGSTPAGARF